MEYVEHGVMVQGRRGRRLGLIVTDADREYVKALAQIGVPTRVIAEKLGEQYGLGRPLTNFCLYYHFREEIESAAPSRARVAPDPQELEELRQRYAEKVVRPSKGDTREEIQSLIDRKRQAGTAR